MHFVISTIFRNKVFFLEKSDNFSFFRNIAFIHLTTDKNKAKIFASEEKAKNFQKKLKLESVDANKFFKIINTKYIRNLETKDEELTLRKERKIKSFFSKIFRKKK